MNYKFDSPGEGVYRVQSDQNNYLGIASGLESSILKTIDRDFFTRKPGYILRGKELIPWEVGNIFINKDELVPAGRWIAGKPLTETAYSIDLLFNLVKFFTALKKNGVTLQIITPSGIYITDNKEILLFPPDLMNLVAKHQEEAFLVKRIEPFNHPDLDGERQVSFFLGVIAYRTFTGELPFTGSTATEIRERIRRSKPVPPHLKAPGLREEVSDLIMRSILPAQNEAAVDEWEKILTRYKREDLFAEAISSESMVKTRTRAQNLDIKREKSFRRHQFIGKHGKTIAAAAAVALIAAIILYTPLKKALAPPVTAGMSPEKVVWLYYESINNLDTESLDDCNSSKTGEKDIKEVTGMFVISKVRTGYEGKSGLIQANEWLTTGQKPLNPDENIYGLTDITVKKITENTFTVTYTKWYTEREETPISESKPGTPRNMHITDTVHLAMKNNVWIIDRIDRSIESD